MLGAVAARMLQDGTKSIHPAGDTSYVFVVLDDTGTALKAPVSAIEKVM